MVMTMMEVDKMDLRFPGVCGATPGAGRMQGMKYFALFSYVLLHLVALVTVCGEAFFDWTVLINPNAHPFEVRISWW